MEGQEFLSMDQVNVKGKVVLLRVDMNVPYNPQTGAILDSERIRAHAQTVKELSDKSARVVILTHQGRRGDPDFIHLTQHADLISKHTGKPILYVDDVIGEKAVKAIRRLQDGEILLLDNIRILEDEAVERSTKEHGDSSIVKTLSPLADLFINDAFSVAHRSHASIVGFTTRLPSAAGRVMEREIKSCEKALNASRPRIFILGGVKADDCVGIMKHMLEKQFLNKALTCGLLGQLLLIVNGFDVGEESRRFLEKKGALRLVPILKDLQSNYAQNMEYPLDVAEQVDGTRVEKNREDLPCKGLIMDIGHKTIDRYRELLENAGSIVVKGPAGVCEEKGFEVGTRALLEKIKSSHAYTLIGGGHTSAVLSSLGLRETDFSYVSVAGGALITYLSGRDLPGLKALEEAAGLNRVEYTVKA